jgi:hypothetical protein
MPSIMEAIMGWARTGCQWEAFAAMPAKISHLG